MQARHAENAQNMKMFPFNWRLAASHGCSHGCSMLLMNYRDHSIRTITIRDGEPRDSHFKLSHSSWAHNPVTETLFFIASDLNSSGYSQAQMDTHTHTRTQRVQKWKDTSASSCSSVLRILVQSASISSSNFFLLGARARRASETHTHKHNNTIIIPLLLSRGCFQGELPLRNKERKEAFTHRFYTQIYSILIILTETPSKKKEGWDTDQPVSLVKGVCPEKLTISHSPIKIF